MTEKDTYGVPTEKTYFKEDQEYFIDSEDFSNNRFELVITKKISDLKKWIDYICIPDYEIKNFSKKFPSIIFIPTPSTRKERPWKKKEIFFTYPDNFENVMHVVKRKGIALEQASDRLKNNREIVLTAVKQNSNAFIFASEKLKNDREFVLEAIKYFPDNIFYASKKLQNDPEIFLKIMRLNPSLFNSPKFEKFRNDEKKNGFRSYKK